MMFTTPSYITEGSYPPGYPPVYFAGSYPTAPAYEEIEEESSEEAEELTEEIHEETIDLLDKAKNLAGSILNRKLPVSSPSATYIAKPMKKKVSSSPIHIDLSDRSWKMFNREESHVHHHHYRSDSRKEKGEEKDDTAQRLVIGAVGLAAVLGTAFFMGKVMAEQEETQTDDGDFQDSIEKWKDNKESYPVKYRKKVFKIIKHTEAILERRATNQTHYIALLFLGFIAGGAAVAGAAFKIQALMGGGAILGAIFLAGLLFKFGQTCSSTRDQKDAEKIEEILDNLPPLVIRC